ncbi:hypothetical protein [Lactococcus petauri]|uniref:hypothetical protein n=1 Tax=Lactococcus petauri TaxID=1940789 RepID=UPI00254B1237|nr:hypothetical protein [Lactococcus petauri]
MKSTCYLCDKQVETEELEVGQYPICDECVKRMEDEDKLDPAQKEHNFPKYDLDADFWRNRWVESSAEALQQQLKLIKLEKKLATAVEALKEVERSKYGMQFRRDRNPAIAKQALTEIGAEDEN